MPNLIAASAYFLLIHFGVSGTKLRDTLVARLGEGPYRGAFAVAYPQRRRDDWCVTAVARHFPPPWSVERLGRLT